MSVRHPVEWGRQGLTLRNLDVLEREGTPRVVPAGEVRAMWGWFILAYVVAAAVLVSVLLVFLYRSRHPHHRLRLVVSWPVDGHVPRPVVCTACAGIGVLDKNRNSFGTPPRGDERSRLWKKLLFSHGTRRICPGCQGRGFRSSELPSPPAGARHQL